MGGKQPVARQSAAANSKENKDLNGDGRTASTGKAVSEGKSVYHELADLTRADVKTLGRSFQVFQLLPCMTIYSALPVPLTP